MKLPARYERPSLLSELGWAIDWRLADHDVPFSAEQIDAFEARVSRELLAPAGHKAAAVALDRIAPGKRIGGRPAGQRGDDEGWGQLARNYLEVLGEIPADLLPLAIARTLREWMSPELPPPGFVRSRVAEELAERELIGAKLRSMRLKLESDGRQRVRFSAVLESDRRRSEAVDEAIRRVVGETREQGRAAEPSAEEAAALRERDRDGFLQKLAETTAKEPAE